MIFYRDSRDTTILSKKCYNIQYIKLNLGTRSFVAIVKTARLQKTQLQKLK